MTVSGVSGIKFEDLATQRGGAVYHWLDGRGEHFWLNRDGDNPSQAQRFWREGVCIAPGLLGERFIDAYCDLVEREGVSPAGWAAGMPYMRHPEILDVCCNQLVSDFLSSLFDGQDLGLHLNLTGWVSTERNWHQDCYLSPEPVGSHYVAVWFALDDIHPDAGPFEYAVGSHELPPMSQKRVFEHLTPSEQRDPDWPKNTEPWIVAACEEVIRERGYPVKQFLGKRGDVLCWHSRLLHRGSPPKVPGMARKAIIAHYSVLSHRMKIDMPKAARHEGQGWYFVL